MSEPTVYETFRLVRRIRACEGEAAGVALLADFARRSSEQAEARLARVVEALAQIESQCAGHADEFSRNVFALAAAARGER